MGGRLFLTDAIRILTFCCSALPFPQLLQKGAHVFGHCCFEGVVLAFGVLEMQEMGMQGEAGEDGAFFFFGLGEFEVAFEGGEEDGACFAVEFVTNNGVAEGLHVYTDLVGAAGV